MLAGQEMIYIVLISISIDIYAYNNVSRCIRIVHCEQKELRRGGFNRSNDVLNTGFRLFRSDGLLFRSKQLFIKLSRVQEQI